MRQVGAVLSRFLYCFCEVRVFETHHAKPLSNLSITGHLRCFSDQRVAENVQCGEPRP